MTKELALECAKLRDELFEKDLELDALRAVIEELARHDPLTGVLNRRSLLELLNAELQRSLRTGHPFSFAIIDLDHIRTVNETYGHPVGDVVLQTVANTAMKLLRTIDRFGRLDGAEFGIVLPATWLDQGAIAMQRLTKAVEACNWDEAAPGLTITFSAGLTTNAPGDTTETITKRASQALAQAKREGRNRVVQAEEGLP